MIPPGVHRISNPRQIHLEEFYQNEYMQKQDALEQLTLGFSTPPDYLDVTLDGFYLRCIDNLKMTFVNLKRLRFEGGYVNRPDEEIVSPLHFIQTISLLVVRCAIDQPPRSDCLK